MINNKGDEGANAWGKPAAWVDYYGQIDGRSYGVAIFDHKENLRHPTTWHARDYGLFAVNPFGLHDFNLGAKGAGDHTVPLGGSLRFRYRVFFHHGDTKVSQVVEQFSAYADPPVCAVKW